MMAVATAKTLAPATAAVVVDLPMRQNLKVFGIEFVECERLWLNSSTLKKRETSRGIAFFFVKFVKYRFYTYYLL